MASTTFDAILKQELGRKYSRRQGTQTADIRTEAIAKAASLTSMFTIRAEEGLLEEDIDSFEDAASKYVERILQGMADEDIEKLTAQTTFRESKRTKTQVRSQGLLIDKRNRVISPLNLEKLLNLTLHKYAKELMGSGDRLVNRTGRLANSGTITEIKENPESRRVSFHFTYMLYPYEIFERPERSDAGKRSPAKLFQEAIHNALDDLLKHGTLPKGEGMRYMYFGSGQKVRQ